MQKPPINWTNAIVLTLTPIAALVFIPWYGFTTGFTLFEWLMFGFFMAMTGFSITGGYHRLWSHKAYKSHWTLRLWFAIWGATSLQNSVFHWASDHRRHHRFVDDNDRDPYSAGRGFWFSHIGWILRNYPVGEDDFSNIKDLQRDPILVWQHKHYLAIAIIMNAGVPLAIGALTGKLWGTLLLAGLLRIVLNHHFTFFINSLAHIWGRRPYTEENSARDNDLLAIFTYGEGYHNFHHKFQHDYRNGISWWHYDPSKWFIRMGTFIGLTSELKSATKFQIEKARLTMQYQRALKRLATNEEQHATWHSRLDEVYEQCMQAIDEFGRVKQKWVAAKKETMRATFEKIDLSDRYAELKYNLKLQRYKWRMLTQQLSLS